jgi:hypothetical protein
MDLDRPVSLTAPVRQITEVTDNGRDAARLDCELEINTSAASVLVLSSIRDDEGRDTKGRRN